MSLKSIFLSVLGVLLFLGFAFLTLFLFGINIALGILGIVLTLVIPPIVIRSAVASAKGIIDKLIAKIIVPIASLLGLGAIVLSFFLDGLPF